MEPVAHGSLAVAQLFSVAGRVALVTGGGRGVGEMVARALAENGARVYIASRAAAPLARAAARLTAAGPGTCHAIAADVSTEAGCRALAEEVAAREGGRLDILVNNAGVSWGAPLADFPEAQWDRALALNLKAPFLLTRACRPLLEAAHAAALAAAAAAAASAAASAAGGAGALAQPPPSPSRVVNIGSIVGERAQQAPTFAYDASKAALHALTRKLAAELAPRITVNALAPGYVPTRMSRGLLAYGDADALRRAVPMQRFGSAADVGGAALFLCSAAGAWVTGSVLVVDGGSLAAPMRLLADAEPAAAEAAAATTTATATTLKPHEAPAARAAAAPVAAAAAATPTPMPTPTPAPTPAPPAIKLQ